MSELLPSIRQLSSAEKLHLIRILAEELDTKEEMFPFQPNRVYYLATPYQSFGAGRALMTAMEQESKS
jgi:hypothetical protein